MILASDVNMQLKMNICILYILCTLLHFLCFLFLPEPFSHLTYRNQLTWLPSLSYVVQSNQGTLNFHRQQWVFNVSSLLVAAFESCRNRQVPPSVTVTMFALQLVAVSAGRSGSVNFFGTVSHLYCRQRFLAFLLAGQLLVADHTIGHSNDVPTGAECVLQFI